MCFVHLRDPLSSEKFEQKTLPPPAYEPWVGGILGNARETGPERDNHRKIAALSGLDWEPFRWGFLYSPFTAVDEKIPLSVGQVNSKPQYLVFSSHFQHRLAKSSSHSRNPANFVVESAKQA
jgi:hypothetical protein